MKYKKTDFYSKKAKKDHYPARSVYKLEEIDKKHHFIRPHSTILDLGCAPGSWVKYCSQKIEKNGFILGIDRTKVHTVFPENTLLVTYDILSEDIISSIQEILSGKHQNTNRQFDVILSDMAPSTSGIRSMDHQRSLALAFKALDIAEELLAPGGVFLCKFFQGEDNNLLLDRVRNLFQNTVLEKPASSKKSSVELFVLGKNKKGEGRKQKTEDT